MAVGDLVAAKVLQGVCDEKEFKLVKKVFGTFMHLDFYGCDLAVTASQNHHVLRVNGITIRKTLPTLIATRCIDNGHTLLHADHEFAPFATHLGLREAYSAARGD